MLVAPTEPAALRVLGTVSSIPERYGADFLIPSASFGAVGVQRKELSDFVASANDSRLAKEVAQLKQLRLGVVLLEGRVQWTNDGRLATSSSWDRARHLGTMWSLASESLWTMSSVSLDDTREWLLMFTKWLAKERHGSLRNTRTPVTKDEWGTKGNREWAIHLLMGFEGIGPSVAAAIYDHFGRIPFAWDVTAQQLQEVAGVGKGRAERLIRALADPIVQAQAAEAAANVKGEWLGPD